MRSSAERQPLRDAEGTCPARHAAADELPLPLAEPYDVQLALWLLVLELLQNLARILGRLALRDDRVVSRINEEIAHILGLPASERLKPAAGCELVPR
jgi:hypothetical protein